MVYIGEKFKKKKKRKRKLSALCMRCSICDFHWLHSIRHFRDDKGTGAEMRPTIVAGSFCSFTVPLFLSSSPKSSSKHISAIRDKYLNKE